MRKIPLKNYIIVIIISVFTILGIILSIKLYKRQINYNNENSFILENIVEVRVSELESLIIEADDIMIYVADKYNPNQKIRKDIKKIIEKNDYNKDMVFIDANAIDDSFYKVIVDKYASSSLKSQKIVPDSLIIIKDAKIINIININEKKLSYLEKIINKSFYGEK